MPFYKEQELFCSSIRLYTSEIPSSTVISLANKLHKEGIRPGQRVAFLAPTSENTILLFFALFYLGAVACPLSTRLNNIIPSLDALDAHYLVDNTLSCKKYKGLHTTPSLATLIFTSGSTDTPKIAAHTLLNHIDNALGVNEKLQLNQKHTWNLCLPLYHVSGISILFRCLLAQARILLSSIEDPKASHLSLVPTQLFRLLQKDIDLADKTLIIGGAPIPEHLLLQAHKQGALPLPTYGMTEMSSQITLGNTLLAKRELKIAADGEILVKGAPLFQGYWKKENIVEKALDKEGWFATKDLGANSQTSYVHILGRKDNLFISGGENIYPEEIERAILSLPHITEAYVIPVQDPEFGNRPVAFIPQGAPYTLDTLKDHLRPLLPGYKLPTKLFFLDPLDPAHKRSRKGLATTAAKKII